MGKEDQLTYRSRDHSINTRTLFVINNGVIAQSEIRRQTIFLGDLWSWASTGLYLPDLKKLAETYGLGYCLIEGARNLGKQIQRLGPCLVEEG